MRHPFLSRQKPLYFNRYSPQAKGLVACFPLFNGVRKLAIDSVAGRRGVGNAGSVRLDHITGKAVEFRSGDTAYDINTANYYLPDTSEPSRGFSCSFWVKYVGASNGMTPVSFSPTSGSAFEFQRFISDSRFRFLYKDAAGASQYLSSINGTLSTTEMNHIVVVAHDTSIEAYVNGSLYTSDTDSSYSNTFPSNSGSAYIGGNRHGTVQYVDVADVRVYHRKLGASAVWGLYNPKTRWDLYTPPPKRNVYVPTAVSSGNPWYYYANQQLITGRG